MFSWICAKAGRTAIFGLIAGLDQVASQALANIAERRGRFVRDLPGSNALHWGDGIIMMNANKIWLDGKISPGPDCRQILALEFVYDGAAFLAIKAESRQIGATGKLGCLLLCSADAGFCPSS